MDVLRGIENAMRFTRVYPTTHPISLKAIERVKEPMRSLFREEEEVRIGGFQETIIYDGEPLPKTKVVLDIAHALYTKGISALTLFSDIEDGEIGSLLELLSTTPRTVREEGGAVAFLEKRGVRHLVVEEADYSGLLEKGEGEDLSWEEKEVLLAKYLSGEILLFEEEKALIRLINEPPSLAKTLMRIIEAKGAKDKVALLTESLSKIRSISIYKGDIERVLIETILNLSSSLMVGFIKREGNIERFGETFSRLEDGEIAEMMAVGVEVEDPEGLGAVFTKLVPDWERRMKILPLIRRYLLNKMSIAGFEERWRAAKEFFDGRRPPLSIYHKEVRELGLGEWEKRTEYPPISPEEISTKAFIRDETEVLIDLLEYLGGEEDYIVVLKRLKEKVIYYTKERDYGFANRILEALSERRDVGEGFLDEIGSEEVIRSLISDLSISGKETRREIASYLLHFGEKVTHLVMEALAQERHLGARKAMINILTQIGGARRELLNWLDDPRWYVVRNAIYILSRMKDPTIVGSLASKLKHSDRRVRREVIFGLGRVGGDEALGLLMDVVRGKDREMKRYAIISLGLLGDQRVVPLFLEIFERRDPFNRMVEGKMEVLRALGQMKAIGAVPQLARVLRGRDWIPSRKRKELKLLIAQTLKEIGSGEAISALEWVYENRRGKVGKRCGELLGKEQG